MSTENNKKKEYAKKLYEAGKLDTPEIAKNLGVTLKTLKGWIKKEGWKVLKSSEITKATALASQIVDCYESNDDSLLGMVNGLLPRIIKILNRTLQIYEEQDMPVPLRDCSALLSKLMEIRGKITGETTGQGFDQESLRSQTLVDMRSITQKIPSGLKAFNAYSDTIDLKTYEVKEIE